MRWYKFVQSISFWQNWQTDESSMKKHSKYLFLLSFYLFVRFLLILLLSIWSHFSTQANTFDIFYLLLLQNTTSFIFLSSFLFLSIYSFLFLYLYFILSPPFSLSSILSNFLFLSRPFSIFLPPSLPFCFVRPFSNYFTNFFLSPALSLFLPFSLLPQFEFHAGLLFASVDVRSRRPPSWSQIRWDFYERRVKKRSETRTSNLG